MHESLIDRYEAGAGALHEAIRGLTPVELNAPPPAGSSGSWTLQEIVVHTYDSDLIGVHRMRRVIAEDRPLLIGYDETRFAASLCYPSMEAAHAAEAYRLNRVIMTATLKRVLAEQGPGVFERWGVHNESGRKSLADFVRSYIDHTEHHMKFIREKRRLMSKPM
jgi:hypothetical protein